MKIVSYNINGLRAVLKKGFINWLQTIKPDIICLQEIKANEDQIPLQFFEEIGYTYHIHSAEKKGYSGVAIFHKHSLTPTNISLGMNNEIFDNEGRVMRIDFPELSILNTYMPSGASKKERQEFKFQFLDAFNRHIIELPKKIKTKLVITGDFNIAHLTIDVHNPTRLKNTPGFTMDERTWLTKFLDLGFTDSFRYFNNEPHNYSWWSYMNKSRERNVGWRIDYILSATTLNPQLQRCVILKSAMHSDHAPLLVEIEE